MWELPYREITEELTNQPDQPKFRRCEAAIAWSPVTVTRAMERLGISK
jgi:hypothetical protein